MNLTNPLGSSGIEATDLTVPLSRTDLAALNLRGLHCSSGYNLLGDFLNCISQPPNGALETEPGKVYKLHECFYLQYNPIAPLQAERESFEWILSEHLIQRLTLNQAVDWLRELHRALKPGGVIRISTPDLALYVSGYHDPKQVFYQEHQARLQRMGLSNCPSRPAWMINQIFRNYGHQWIYDFDEIKLVAQAAGFDPNLVRRCSYRQGAVSELAALDQEIRSDESLYVEIQKAGKPAPVAVPATVQTTAPQALPLRELKPLQQPVSPDAVSVFAIIGDEPYFLPHFLKHYRQLGVGAFTLYLDRPSPQTLQFLEQQCDVELLTSDLPYGTTFGKHKTGALIRLHHLLQDQFTEQRFAGRWALTVDADEFAVLPSGFSNLGEFCRHLDQRNLVHVSAPMVDFYPARLSERNFNPNLSPFEGCPWFDQGPYYEWQPPALLPHPLQCGVRERITGYLATNHPQEWRQVVGPNYAYQPPKVWKVPLMKHGCGIQRQLMHEASATPPSDINLALAHFKYHPGVDAKVAQAISRAEHYRGALEYKIMDLAFRRMATVDLIQAASSHRWNGATALKRARLLN